MRIAISSQGENLESNIDPRFGRAAKFLLVETETMDFEVVENKQSLNLPQGAGIQAAQNIVNHQPEVVLTGNCGPKAFKVLKAAGVGVVVGVTGTVEEALQAYLEGKHKPADAANVEGHWS